VNDLLPLPIKSKAQMAMNHTKRAKNIYIVQEKSQLMNTLARPFFGLANLIQKNFKIFG